MNQYVEIKLLLKLFKRKLIIDLTRWFCILIIMCFSLALFLQFSKKWKPEIGLLIIFISNSIIYSVHHAYCFIQLNKRFYTNARWYTELDKYDNRLSGEPIQVKEIANMDLRFFRNLALITVSMYAIDFLIIFYTIDAIVAAQLVMPFFLYWLFYTHLLERPTTSAFNKYKITYNNFPEDMYTRQERKTMYHHKITFRLIK